MLKIRYIFRLISAFTQRFKGIFVVGILIGFIFFVASRILSPFLVINSKEVIGITGRYHTDEIPNEILSLIGEGLTKISDDGSPEPALSTIWETPDKGKTWIFTLDESFKWHDGKDVESYDIAYEFSDVDIETPDENTIIFKLKEPFSPFPSVVSKPTFRKGLLGTGKWKVKNVSLAGSFVQELTLEKDQENNSKIRHLKVFKFYPTENQTKLAFKLGGIDTIFDTFDLTPFNNWDTVNLNQKTKYNQIITLFFNTKDKYMAEKTLRQALIYAIDKESFEGDRAISPISSKSWVFNPQVKKYEYDEERAKELIDDLDPEIKGDLQIKLVSSPLLLNQAEYISSQWKNIGIPSVVQVSSVIPNEFQVFLTIFDTPNDPDQYSLWHSTQEETNISKYTSPRIDKLLEDGRVELDTEERKKIYLDFQRFIVEDSPAAFLYNPTVFQIKRR